MKKIIALILAVALSLSMASVAFAAENFADMANAHTEGAAIRLGDEIKLTGHNFAAVAGNKGDFSDLSTLTNYFSTTYFSATVRWDNGGKYVESAKFDNDGAFVIKFKGDAVKVPGISNLKLKELKLRATKDIGKVKVGNDYEYDVKSGDTFVPKGGTGTNGTSIINVGLYFGAERFTDLSVGDDVDVTDKGLYIKFNKTSSDSFATSYFNFGDNLAYGEVRVYDKDEVFVKANGDINKDIVRANENAEIKFVNLTGKFNSAMTLDIYADEGEILYELKDGKLIKSAAKYNVDRNAFVIKTNTLGAFVISDIELVNAATATTDKNPDTGANDVVGVAVALAVVSLVAAGAVSLKK